MQNRYLLGVSVGEAFAEYCLLEGTQVLSTKRAYLSRENLKNSLQQFVSSHRDKAITKAAVSLRVPEKLLDYKLNGAVAHLTTEGFEGWLELKSQEINGEHKGLTTSNLQFSVRERLHADGQVALALDIEELAGIATKLQELGTKKICLHFLHASLYPVHEEKAADFFKQKGFEVFVPQKTDNGDELSRWRRNALNATVANLFSELKNNIHEALQECLPASHIFFLKADGEFSQDIEAHAISGLAAAYTAMALSQQDSAKTSARDILYLGLENFALISPKKWQTQWHSPWGAVENKHVSFKELSVQPTLAVELNAFRHFDFNKQSEGWEPGPMFLGRGQKPTLMDLWSENAKLSKIDGLQDRLVSAGVQRFKNALFALTKVSAEPDQEFPIVTKELQSLSIQKLALEASLFRHSEHLLVTGPLAELFSNGFKKDLKAKVEVDEFAMSRSVALLAQALLKD